MNSPPVVLRKHKGRIDLSYSRKEELDAWVKSQQREGKLGYVTSGNDSLVFRIGDVALKLYSYASNQGFSPEALSRYGEQLLAAKTILEKGPPWYCKTFHNALTPPGDKKDPYSVGYSVVPIKPFLGIGPNLEILLRWLVADVGIVKTTIGPDVPVAIQKFVPGRNVSDSQRELTEAGVNYHLLDVFLNGVWQTLEIFGLPTFEFSPVNAKAVIEGKRVGIVITDLASRLI